MRATIVVPGVLFQHFSEAVLLERCDYHNLPMNSSSFSPGHKPESDFPWITTTILEVHKDEVWNIKWSHDGAYLASASKDKSAIIWRRRVSVLCSSGEIMFIL
jgi:WD40 repeat protein